jgi:hypothetical protein
MAVRANYGPAFLGWSPEAAVRDRPALDVSAVPGGKIGSVDIAPPPQVQLVREAVAALAAEPADQMSRWPGALVTDELALDFENAYASCRSLEAGVVFGEEALALMAELDTLLAAPPDSPAWSHEALPSHPVWTRARVMARQLLALPPLALDHPAPQVIPDPEPCV